MRHCILCLSRTVLNLAVLSFALMTGAGVFADRAAAQTAGKAGDAGSQADPLAAVVQPVTDWLERANREYQDHVVRELSVPTGKPDTLSTGEPSLLDKVKALVGLETVPTKPADPAAVAEAAKREEALKRQIEARKLEQIRNAELERSAEQQRLAAEAKKTAELEQATKQSQRAAEAARVAEEQRRKAAALGATADARKPGGPGDSGSAKGIDEAAAKLAEAERKAKAAADKAAAEKATADKASAERKALAEANKAAAEQAAANKAAAARKAVADAEKAAAEKAAADKVSAERKAVAAADAAKRAREEDAQRGLRETEQKAAEAARKLAQAAPRPVAPESAAGEGITGTAGRPAASRAADGRSSGERTGDKATKARMKVAAHSAGHGDGNGGKRGKAGRCSRAGQVVDIPAIYVVKRGDTLWDISRRYYNKGHRFEKIVQANQDKIASPDLIYPCQKFFLPGRSALYWVFTADELDAS